MKYTKYLWQKYDPIQKYTGGVFSGAIFHRGIFYKGYFVLGYFRLGPQWWLCDDVTNEPTPRLVLVLLVAADCVTLRTVEGVAIHAAGPEIRTHYRFSRCVARNCWHGALAAVYTREVEKGRMERISDRLLDERSTTRDRQV